MRLSNGPIRPADDFLIFGSPLIGEEEIDEVVATLRSGWLGTGPRVAQFEQEFAAYKGSPRAAAVNSCTAALHLSMLAADLPPGSEVITTALTFCATVNAIIHAGCKPVLADIDPATLNIDVADVANKVTSRTSAIIPVHFAGRPCDMDSLMDLARSRDLIVIEDCAHAIEATYRHRPVGTIGDFGCFSFYVTKNVITGEGGMVLTNETERIDRIKVLALHGMSKDAWHRFGDEGYRHYFVTEAGFKYNMTDMQAAIGIHQLRRAEGLLERRREIWARYLQELEGLPIELPAPFSPNTRHALHLFTIMIEAQSPLDRDGLLAALTRENIGAGVHYLSVAEHPYYQSRYGWQPNDEPHARDAGRRILSLPLSGKLTDRDVTDVIEALRKVIT